MGMGRAAGTITQVLSVVDCPPVFYESVRPALGNTLNRKKDPPREFTARQLYYAKIFASPTRAKLPDYIEVILHCKEASAL